MNAKVSGFLGRVNGGQENLIFRDPGTRYIKTAGFFSLAHKLSTMCDEAVFVEVMARNKSMIGGD